MSKYLPTALPDAVATHRLTASCTTQKEDETFVFLQITT